ncbi:sulfite exporter TauE/SafE family protein [Dactylosporangium sp. AC04546]|uniref:sulfite exporter TauE/SafE family protein n=1 Tax=Dactylosporangium sp. AC04546 TaxID=2862460 RepID=UPI001EDCB09A|nr:sulfite exporter TauE/SafE family protein [Dactylosporangium sp. AC04546]WVK79188.1 sulfite exporter TauE/SafE family protein [Dactylosporangium sp. AC04546]
MSTGEMLAVLVAGLAAGAINTVVGSGTLVTFPVLLATGLAPLTATVSNAIGMTPGSVSGAIGYRKELPRSRMLVYLGAGAALGGLTGATLLLVLPARAFDVIVPVLVALALVLVALQPLVARWTSHRRDNRKALFAGLTLASVYGGYFAAAQGILYMALMGALLDEPAQRRNAVKNVLVAVVNTAASAVLLLHAHVDWTAVALLAAGSATGGQLGARLGRRLSPAVLRVLILAVGTVALIQLLRR